MAGRKLRTYKCDDDLYEAALRKAASEVGGLAGVIRRLLREWLATE